MALEPAVHVRLPALTGAELRLWQSGQRSGIRAPRMIDGDPLPSALACDHVERRAPMNGMTIADECEARGRFYQARHQTYTCAGPLPPACTARLEQVMHRSALAARGAAAWDSGTAARDRAPRRRDSEARRHHRTQPSWRRVPPMPGPTVSSLEPTPCCKYTLRPALPRHPRTPSRRADRPTTLPGVHEATRRVEQAKGRQRGIRLRELRPAAGARGPGSVSRPDPPRSIRKSSGTARDACGAAVVVVMCARSGWLCGRTR